MHFVPNILNSPLYFLILSCSLIWVVVCKFAILSSAWPLELPKSSKSSRTYECLWGIIIWSWISILEEIRYISLHFILHLLSSDIWVQSTWLLILRFLSSSVGTHESLRRLFTLIYSYVGGSLRKCHCCCSFLLSHRYIWVYVAFFGLGRTFTKCWFALCNNDTFYQFWLIPPYFSYFFDCFSSLLLIEHYFADI